MTSSLLSRRQLSLLILILPGIILLLSLLDPAEHAPATPAPLRISSNDQRVYQQVMPDQKEYRLHLLLPSPPSADAHEQLGYQLLLTALQQHLGTLAGEPIQLEALPGHIRLEQIHTSPPTSAAIQHFLKQLQQPPELDWNALLRHQQARQYLTRQQTEGWLQSGGEPAVAETLFHPSERYRHWLKPAHWQVTLSGPKASPLTLPAAQAPSAHSDTSLAVTLVVLPVNPPTGTDARLLRWPLPAPATPRDLALNLLARQHLQQRLSTGLQRTPAGRNTPPPSRFSLTWALSQPRGQAGLMVQGISPPNLGALLHIPITNAELDRARQSLMAQRTDMTDQQSWLDLLALYSLPANSFSQLSQQLDAIDTATLQHWLQTQLESDYYHTLSLPASP